MKKVIAIVLVLVMLFIIIAATTRQEDNIAEEVTPYVKTADNLNEFDYYHRSISSVDFIMNIDPLEPITDTACSYNQSTCVANIQFAYANGQAEAWDIYFYNNDGIIGTQIVNQQGEYINFYSDVLTEINSNYNVCIGKRVYVYPAGDDLSTFTLVLEHG